MPRNANNAGLTPIPLGFPRPHKTRRRNATDADVAKGRRADEDAALSNPSRTIHNRERQRPGSPPPSLSLITTAVSESPLRTHRRQQQSSGHFCSSDGFEAQWGTRSFHAYWNMP